METLAVVMFVIFIACAIFQLARSNSFGRFIVGVLADAFILGILYVILHFAIKYW